MQSLLRRLTVFACLVIVTISVCTFKIAVMFGCTFPFYQSSEFVTELGRQLLNYMWAEELEPGYMYLWVICLSVWISPEAESARTIIHRVLCPVDSSFLRIKAEVFVDRVRTIKSWKRIM